MIKKISNEEYKDIEANSLASREILEDDRFQFLRDYLQSTLDYVEKSILENTIHTVHETATITDKIKKTFIVPKKVQVDELCGQYKLIKKLFDDLRYYADLKKDLDNEMANGKVVVSE